MPNTYEALREHIINLHHPVRLALLDEVWKKIGSTMQAHWLEGRSLSREPLTFDFGARIFRNRLGNSNYYLNFPLMKESDWYMHFTGQEMLVDSKDSDECDTNHSSAAPPGAPAIQDEVEV